jgi:hypothetical protein
MDYLYTSFLQPLPKLILKKTNWNKIEEIIRLMKPKSVHGYDGITANLIKASTPLYHHHYHIYVINPSLHGYSPLV